MPTKHAAFYFTCQKLILVSGKVYHKSNNINNENAFAMFYDLKQNLLTGLHITS